MNLIEKNTGKIKELCRKHKVAKLYVFGSAAKQHLRKDSDIDFIVAFDQIGLDSYADNYFDLKFSLEDLFNRKVDLLEEQAIKNPFLKQSIDRTKILIYG